MKFNLALAQINTKLGKPQDNLEKHLSLAKNASQDGVDLLVFPELSLTGYVLQDLVPIVSCRPDSGDPIFKHLLDASHDIDMVIGFVDEDARHRFYIACAYLAKDQGYQCSPLSDEYFQYLSNGTNQIVWVQNAEPLSLWCADE